MDGAPIRLRQPRAIHLFAPGTDLRDRYEVLEAVRGARGGVLYRAIDRERGHEVALRLIPTAPLSAEELLRLRRSLAVLRRAVPDPRLVRVLEVVERREALYVATEALSCESLRQRLQEGSPRQGDDPRAAPARPIPVEEALALAGEVLRALHSLHELGLLHLNLRPENVLLTGGRVRLAEAALPAPWRDDAPLDEKTVGVDDPALHVSPEQARGLELDARSDLYSAGVLLFELLTGHLPYEGLGSVETALAHVRTAIPDPRERNPAVPRWLAEVVKRLLAKDPERRYATALEVLADLESRRASRPVARKRWPRLLATQALVAVCLALGLWRWLSSARREAGFFVDTTRRRLEVFDETGHFVWSRDGVAAAAHVAQVHAGGALTGFAALRAAPPRLSLDVFEPRGGTSVRAIALEDLAGPGAVPLELRTVKAGRGEQLVASLRTAEGGGLVALCDPEPSGLATRALLSASGPHRPAGTLDLDGDGQEELIVAGSLTGAGWYAGVAALKVEAITGAPAASPDLANAAESLGLAWYALAPLDLAGRPLAAVRVDQEHGRVVLEYGGGRLRHLNRYGFVEEEAVETGFAERRDARRRAYRLASEALGQLREGAFEKAAAASARALADARLAADRVLVEWTGRLRLGTLRRAEEVREAQLLARELLGGAASASGVAFDAARALHRAGALGAAASWYRLAATLEGEFAMARRRGEILEGELLCLDESGALADAMTEVDRFDALGGFRLDLAPYRGWVRARLARRAPTDERVRSLSARLDATRRDLDRRALP